MRYISEAIVRDLKRKLVLLAGPRQSGKTTLSKSLQGSFEYLNFDIPEERKIIFEKSWNTSKDILILDELHKQKSWKSYLKSLTDSSSHRMQTLVTGSARLDISKKVGDSLAGRYYLHHLHPIDIKEAVNFFGITAEDAFERIMNVGGFPEPFLSNSKDEYHRWRRTHTDIIIKQDLIHLETVEEITKIETLVELLRERVGSTVAYSNLAKDLDVAPKSVKRWLGILENLYVIFKVTPVSSKSAHAIKKAPKYYFYDCGSVIGDSGAKFENLVALSLKKEIDFRRDAHGKELELRYARDKSDNKIDFIIVEDKKAALGIECKWSDTDPHRAFNTLGRKIHLRRAVQLVAKCDYEKNFPNLEVQDAKLWLQEMKF